MQYLDVKEIAKKWDIPERKVTALCREGRIIGAKKDGRVWIVPSNAKKPLDARTKEYAKSGDNAKVLGDSVKYTATDAANHVTNAFKEVYKKAPDHTAFTPYRICPVGAHTDHNLGKITGFAVDKGIHMAYGAKQNGVIEIASLQFPKRAQWHINSTPDKPQNDWADHLRGATIALNGKYPLRVGMCAIIDGELPIGGLSSSAAVIITFLSVLCKLNNIRLTEGELIDISQEAENKYVGVSCGKLDQSCEVYCRKDKLLYLDIKTDEYQLIPANPKMKPYKIMIFFSGVERSLAGSKFNMRVDELRCAAYALKAFSGMEYSKLEETNLRDVPYSVYLEHKEKLPVNWQRRAEHWYSEYDRVEKAALAWEKGDIEAFGELIFKSGKSSIENWETGSPELIKLYELMTECDGIYGGRFSGAGFKGCCMAIVDPNFTDEISKEITKKYLEAFPHLKGKFSIHICDSSDGVNLKY